MTEKVKIKETLKEMKDFYQLGKGEFYHIFIDEITPLLKYPPTKYANSDVNGKILQNTLMYLGWLDKPFTKRINFAIQNKGFDYPDFNHIAGLAPYGNIRHNVNLVRFPATKRGFCQGSLWSNIKQNI